MTPSCRTRAMPRKNRTRPSATRRWTRRKTRPRRSTRRATRPRATPRPTHRTIRASTHLPTRSRPTARTNRKTSTRRTSTAAAPLARNACPARSASSPPIASATTARATRLASSFRRRLGRMPKIVWTDSMQRRLFAKRGTPSATPISVNRDKVWAELCAAPKKIGSKARGKEEESAAKELTRPKSAPDVASMTLAHEVARARYLRVNMRYNTGGNYPRDATPNQMIDFWVASKGLLFAVEAIIATVSGKVQDDYDRPREYELRRDAFPWGRLRHHLAVADDATWKAARALADKARKNAGDDLATALAFAFPEEPTWASKIAKGAVDRGYGELCI